MNKTSLDGDRRLPTSEYRKRRGSTTGIGAAKRLVKTAKPWPIEATILQLFTASIGGFPDAFRRQGQHGDDLRLKGFQLVPSSTETVARNGRSDRVTVAGRVRSDSFSSLSS
ncbi:hypothetical protein AB3S75_034728 [Citrus x aurantiifolia]